MTAELPQNWNGRSLCWDQTVSRPAAAGIWLRMRTRAHPVINDELVHATGPQGGSHSIHNRHARIYVADQLRLALARVRALPQQNDLRLLHDCTDMVSACAHVPETCLCVQAPQRSVTSAGLTIILRRLWHPLSGLISSATHPNTHAPRLSNT